MRRFTFLIFVSSFVVLGGCGSGGDTVPSAAGGSGGGSGSSNAGGSKSGGAGSGGSSSTGGSKSGGAGSSGSSGGAPSGSACAAGCAKIGQLDCPNENPSTCVAECETAGETAYEMYPDCTAEYDAAIECVAATPQANFFCDAMGNASVGEEDCVVETEALLDCFLNST